VSPSWKFRDVKLQWLELLTCASELSGSAICVGAHIVLRYVNNDTESAWPSQDAIANGTGKTVKTIQRAVRELEHRGWFEVVRGNGRSLTTLYRPTATSIDRARALRTKRDKVVILYPEKSGHFCPERRSKVARKDGQECPPNLMNQTNRKPNARPVIPQIFIPVTHIHKLDHWRAWLAALDLPSLDDLGLATSRSGLDGFLLPSNYPPNSADEIVTAKWIEYLRLRNEKTTPSLPALRRPTG